MDEERFNMDMRRFLKTFGVTAQREIERAVEAGLADGTLKGSEVLSVRAVLTVDGLLDQHVVNGEISLN